MPILFTGFSLKWERGFIQILINESQLHVNLTRLENDFAVAIQKNSIMYQPQDIFASCWDWQHLS